MFERNNVGLDQLGQVADDLISDFPGSRIFAFYGILGAGKTTFIREICRSLKSPDIVTSPTFALINEYSMNSGGSIFHFDFFRITSIGEVFDLGYEDYFFSGNYCLIEWPEKIEQLIPETCIAVTITVESEKTRCIKARSMG